MDGTPVRGHEKASIARLNESRDLRTFQTDLIRLVGSQLKHAEAFFGLVDANSKSPQLPSWVKLHLDRHAGLYRKLARGEIVGISHAEENPVPRPVRAARSSVLLIPVTGDGTLQAVIGLVVPVDGPQLSPEDIEDVRKLAVEAAPVLMRLQEIEQLRRQNHELASSAERTKHAEESLAVLLEERNALDAIIRMRSHLHANVAHDLRTPLGTIRGYARMILDGRTGEINDTQRKYLQIVTDNTNRLIALIGWMGYIADLNAQHLDLSTFDLRDVWSECVVASWQRLSEESLKLTEQIPDETFVTVGDRKQLARAFNELIAAAMQYSEPGGTITAEFGHGRDREVTVKISAKGAAIPANILSETFERSFTTIARPAAQDTNGDAINLSDVYSVVGMHGGRFFVNSVAAQGASFLFTLPAVLDDGEENNHEQPVNSSRRRR